MIQRMGVAKISHHANKRRPSTRRGDRQSPIRRLRPVWLLRPPGLVRSPSVPGAVHQPSKGSAGAIQSSPPPQIIGPHPPSRSPPPCRPRDPPGALPLRSLGQAAATTGTRITPRPLSTAPAAISLASSGQARALQASCGLHGHRVQFSARQCAIRACCASQRLAEPHKFAVAAEVALASGGGSEPSADDDRCFGGSDQCRWLRDHLGSAGRRKLGPGSR
jgi:hypothetical protein